MSAESSDLNDDLYCSWIRVTSLETSRIIGQTWCRCNYEWGLDEMICIDTSKGKLVLCNVIQTIGGSHYMTHHYEPCKIDQLPTIC